MSWTSDEILAALRSLGLPEDSPLSVITVEMMPTLQALRLQPSSRAGSANLAASFVAEQAGFGEAPGGDYGEVRPLSDALGNYRILRTSPLTPVPAVCCVGCV